MRKASSRPAIEALGAFLAAHESVHVALTEGLSDELEEERCRRATQRLRNGGRRESGRTDDAETAMTDTPPTDRPLPARGAPPLPCVVWSDPGPPWRARVVLPDASERAFDDPAALAAFLADPPDAAVPRATGLR